MTGRAPVLFVMIGLMKLVMKLVMKHRDLISYLNLLFRLLLFK